jgi:hypothetical protein
MDLLFVKPRPLLRGQRALRDELRRHASGQQRFAVLVLLAAAREATQLGLQVADAVGHRLGVVAVDHVRPGGLGGLLGRPGLRASSADASRLVKARSRRRRSAA